MRATEIFVASLFISIKNVNLILRNKDNEYINILLFLKINKILYFIIIFVDLFFVIWLFRVATININVLKIINFLNKFWLLIYLFWLKVW